LSPGVGGGVEEDEVGVEVQNSRIVRQNFRKEKPLGGARNKHGDHRFGALPTNQIVSLKSSGLNQGILKGEVSLYH
jgi:hypothetical protein